MVLGLINDAAFWGSVEECRKKSAANKAVDIPVNSTNKAVRSW
jgi:hypothetical protein